MPRLGALFAGLLCLALAACAGEYGAGEVGHLTARPKKLVNKDELRNTCAGLAVFIRSRIARLKELEGKANQEQRRPPPSLWAIWEGGPAAAEFAREREHVNQLNAALESKNCQTVDIDAELRRPSPAPSKTDVKKP